MNYFFFSPQALGNHPILKKLPAIGELQRLAMAEAETEFASVREMTQLAQDKAALAQDKAALAQDKAALAQDKTALAQDKAALALSKKMYDVALATDSLIAEYKTHPSASLKKRLEANIESIQAYRKQFREFDGIESEETQKGMVLHNRLADVIIAKYARDVAH
jgi:hypothetical protein